MIKNPEITFEEFLHIVIDQFIRKEARTLETFSHELFLFFHTFIKEFSQIKFHGLYSYYNDSTNFIRSLYDFQENQIPQEEHPDFPQFILQQFFCAFKILKVFLTTEKASEKLNQAFFRGLTLYERNQYLSHFANVIDFSSLSMSIEKQWNHKKNLLSEKAYNSLPSRKETKEQYRRQQQDSFKNILLSSYPHFQKSISAHRQLLMFINFWKQEAQSFIENYQIEGLPEYQQTQKQLIKQIVSSISQLENIKERIVEKEQTSRLNYNDFYYFQMEIYQNSIHFQKLKKYLTLGSKFYQLLWNNENQTLHYFFNTRTPPLFAQHQIVDFDIYKPPVHLFPFSKRFLSISDMNNLISINLWPIQVWQKKPNEDIQTLWSYDGVNSLFDLYLDHDYGHYLNFLEFLKEDQTSQFYHSKKKDHQELSKEQFVIPHYLFEKMHLRWHQRLVQDDSITLYEYKIGEIIYFYFTHESPLISTQDHQDLIYDRDSKLFQFYCSDIINRLNGLGIFVLLTDKYFKKILKLFFQELYLFLTIENPSIQKL